ncbi:MAG: bifunctional hydroxymethylpyrimidine kinase/phosphomethylpyrimidine kinase [Gemmatimonadota bacterium]
MNIPIALTIAGSDSGGGAGIQADLKTFHAFGVYGTSVLTAITAQNTLGVAGVHEIPPDLVRKQIDAVVSDLPPNACKTGMLASAELVAVVAQAMADHELANYVLDPVMVATSGDRLLDADAIGAVRDRLLPRCTVITPNLDEAALLIGAEVADEAGMEKAARALVALGAPAALIKGGHLRGNRVVNLLFDGEQLHRWERPRIATRSTHGTGCTLSAAIACGLARSQSLTTAVEHALGFVHRAIESAPGLGAGHGPLNHWVDPYS